MGKRLFRQNASIVDKKFSRKIIRSVKDKIADLWGVSGFCSSNRMGLPLTGSVCFGESIYEFEQSACVKFNFYIPNYACKPKV
jgi:hypothetical protein